MNKEIPAAIRNRNRKRSDLLYTKTNGQNLRLSIPDAWANATSPNSNPLKKEAVPEGKWTRGEFNHHPAYSAPRNTQEHDKQSSG
jgi:hypothetical protein